MAGYEARRIIERMGQFVASYPHYEEFGIVGPKGLVPDINIADFESGIKTAQLVIDYSGSTRISKTQDVLGYRGEVRQANFTMLLLRDAGDKELRIDTTDFLHDFEHWISYKNSRRDTPPIGDDPYSEDMWADNGNFYSRWDNRKASVYSILLHKTYQLVYREAQ